MKKFFALLMLLLLLSACAVPAETRPTTLPAEPTMLPTAEPTAPPTDPPFYWVIPGVTAEDAVQYFTEVCLDAEFSDSGFPQLLQRWEGPILYTISGEPTPEDLEMIRKFSRWLLEVEGFPGLAEAPEPYLSDMHIYFGTQSELTDVKGTDYAGADGAATFWYNGDNIIYDANVFICTDISQDVRNSVILEELYNSLGPVQDTVLRQDSLIYQGYSTPQWMTPVDELILRLLYHPDMRPGMNAEECEQVIRALYQ